MGTDGFVLACALLQRRVWFGGRPPSAEGLAWRAPSISGGSGLACALHQRRVWLGVRPPSAKGLAWRAPSISEGFGLADALHQRRVWLGVRRCPTCPPSNVFGNRGTPPVPPAGAAPPAPRLGNGGGACGAVQAASLVRRGVCEGVRQTPVDPAGRRTMMERCSGGSRGPYLATAVIVRVRETPGTRTTKCPSTWATTILEAPKPMAHRRVLSGGGRGLVGEGAIDSLQVSEALIQCQRC